MNPLTTCFLALIPDEEFSATVLRYKRLAERRVGAQLYLADPPHLTLYLAAFQGVASLARIARDAAASIHVPVASVCGWHVFHADPLSASHTLVCDIDSDQRRDLANCQHRICAAVSPLHDSESAVSRYASSWERLSESAKANVKQWGFPFVGPIWHPHITIASIRPADWDAIWPALENDPPSGTVRFPKLCLYALEEGRPLLLERFDLESVS